MHQSGQERAHSMQTVQFSSRRAMTPRARMGGASFSRGYCTVFAPWVMVRAIVPSVTPRPLTKPGSLGISATPRARSSEGHLEHGRHHDVEQGDRDQELPGEALQLVLPEAGVGEADPEADPREHDELREQQ